MYYVVSTTITCGCNEKTTHTTTLITQPASHTISLTQLENHNFC